VSSDYIEYGRPNPRDFYDDEWGYYNVWGEFPDKSDKSWYK
jgi:hypothetical protein